MPPRSPLPPRYGLSAAWVRTPDRDLPQPDPWPTMAVWLQAKLGERVEVAALLAEGRFVYADLRAVRQHDAYAPHTDVWFHRDLRDEVPVPGALRVVHRDERIVVVDKPAFLSTIPRGRHVVESVVVRLRAELGLPELSPLHRLDRVTSGLLVLATEQRWRSRYQVLFEQRRVHKTYRALAPWAEALSEPVVVRNHIAKTRGDWRAEVTSDGPVNAETAIELESRRGDLAIYRLTPLTGRTHQLRLHLHGLGVPIVDDPLYPTVLETSIDDFSRPLQLLASNLSFVDPVDGSRRAFSCARRLPLTPER